MPTYQFRCAVCGEFDARFGIHAVPDDTDCPTCGGAAARRPTAVGLRLGSAAARRALEASERSASEPAVVHAVPGRPARPTPISRNPLHQRLPRP